MGELFLTNLSETDSSKIIVPLSDFIFISSNKDGNILLSSDLKSLFIQNGKFIQTIIPKKNQIITFDEDTTYSNGDTLLEDSNWKVRLEGAGSAVQSGGKLILTANGASADISFIEFQLDARVEFGDTWKLRYSYKHTTGFGTNNLGQVVLRNALAVTGLTNAVHWDNVGSESRLRIMSLGDGASPNLKYAVQRKNPAGGTDNVIFIAGQWAGQEVITSMERKATKYTTIFDEDDVTVIGTDLRDIAFSIIRAPHDKDFIQIAASARTDSADAVIELDFISFQAV